MPATADPLDVGFLARAAHDQDHEVRVARTTSPVFNNDTSVKWFLGCFYLVMTTRTEPVHAASTLAACG
jgi:hypothetical protein